MTDNDRLGLAEFGAESSEVHWRNHGVPLMQRRVENVKVEHSPDKNKVTLTVSAVYAPPVYDWGFKTVTVYTVHSDGKIQVDTKAEKYGTGSHTLPKIGMRLALSKKLDHVQWFGRGPGESYADTKLANRFDVWSATVKDLHTPYVVPQENGNRMDVSWVTLTNKQEVGLLVSGEQLNFSARHHTTENLDKARHTYELEESDTIELNIDHQLNGIGSASCGPGVLEKYELKNESFAYSYTLAPYYGGEQSPFSAAEKGKIKDALQLTNRK